MFASNQGTKLPLSAVNKNNSNNKNDKNDKNNQNKNDNTVGKDNVKLAEANNNFYANMGVNLVSFACVPTYSIFFTLL